MKRARKQVPGFVYGPMRWTYLDDGRGSSAFRGEHGRRAQYSLNRISQVTHRLPVVRAVPQHTQGTMRFVVRAYCA
jgi:hypothetical protein